MVSSSKLESLATKCAPYIDDLHDFFRSRNVPFGALGDLQGFLARLTDASFSEEMVSMIRSILYRECEAMPRAELMEVIAVAVGGIGILESSHDLHDSLRQILTFVTEAVRPNRTGAVPEAADERANARPVRFANEPDSTPRQILSVPRTGLLSGAGSESVHVAPPPNSEVPEINNRLSRALMEGEAQRNTAKASVVLKSSAIPGAVSLDPETAAATASAVPDDKIPHPVAVRSGETLRSFPASLDGEASVPPLLSLDGPAASAPRRFANHGFPSTLPQPHSIGSVLRRAYWIPGVFALVLVAAAIWLLQNPLRSRSATAPVHIPAVAASNLPKPSAYGPAIHRSSGSQPSAIASGEHAATSGEGASLPATDYVLQPSSSRSTGVARTASSVPHNSLQRGLSPLVSANLLTGREGVFLASSGMMAAHLISAPAPGYPRLASFTRVQGAVIVQVVVGRDGRVEATRVLDGPHLLRGAAEHAIRRWRYRPYIVDGKTTDVATIVTVNFRLKH